MRMRTKPPTVRRLFLHEAWTEPEYTIFAFAFFFGFLGTYAPLLVHRDVLLSVRDSVTGAYTLFASSDQCRRALWSCCKSPDFLLAWHRKTHIKQALGRLADKIGPVNAFTAASGSCTVLLFGWIGVRNEASVVAFCILYGFFSSGMITLPPTIIATALCPNMSQFGTRFTQQLVPSGIGLLIGNPIAAALLARGWIGLQTFAASAVLICTILTTVAHAIRFV